MNRSTVARVALRAGIAIVALLCKPTLVLAQAWTPAQGEGAVALEYQDAFVKYHLQPTGEAKDRGHIHGQTLLVDVTYGITDKIALSVSLPYVTAKYNGLYPHPTGLDNGSYHSTLQDFRFDLRYNISRKGLVVTPFVGTIVPSNRYEYYAHSAAGRNLRELQIGAYWAKLLDPILPGLFVTGRYSYGFTERVLDISHNRSNLDVEVGYFVRPELRVFGLAAGQLTHGGIGLYPSDLFPNVPALSPALLRHHDQLGNDDSLNLGGGVAYSLTPSTDLFGSVLHTAVGKNVHALQYGLTIGVSWSFMKGRGGAHASRVAPVDRLEAQARRLVKCVCQKGH